MAGIVDRKMAKGGVVMPPKGKRDDSYRKGGKR